MPCVVQLPRSDYHSRQPNTDAHQGGGESHNIAASPRSDLARAAAGSGHVSVSRAAGDSLA